MVVLTVFAVCTGRKNTRRIENMRFFIFEQAKIPLLISAFPVIFALVLMLVSGGA